MKFTSQEMALKWPLLAWLSVALTGVVAPGIAILLFGAGSTPAMPASVVGPVLAVGLMGTGIIAAAAAGRFWTGMILAVLSGSGLLVLSHLLGLTFAMNPVAIALAFIAASISFAARGALFATSAKGKGWWIAVFVVAGEAAILATAAAQPGALPDWLLVLLPAQWANIAIQTALTGDGLFAAGAALTALHGTAAATLLVHRLWPRRWPYIIMFTTWIGLSALVYHWPPSLPSAISMAL